MATLKQILFSQFAGDGLTQLVRETQEKYNPKKGRRFNHENITYEISRPGMVEGNLEFEISSKIPQDDLKGNRNMKGYFEAIKKILSKMENKPVSIEMENIIWDSKRDNEKERDYVKLLYSYPLNDLYNNKDVMARFEKMAASEDSESSPDFLGALTPQGEIVLQMVKETVQNFARESIEQLINANKRVRVDLKS